MTDVGSRRFPIPDPIERTAVSDLTAFLLARLADDEDIARRAGEHPGSYRGHPAGTAPLWTTSASSAYGREVGPRGSVEATPGRILAECAAKRAIVEEYVSISTANYSDYEDGYVAGLERVVGLLAQPYADHPDFREEWR